MESAYVKTTGTANLYSESPYGDRETRKFDWHIDYDGEVVKVNADLTENGKKEHINLTLDNEDISNLLQTPVVRKPLENRLYDDFLVQRKVYKLTPTKKRGKNKTKRNNIKIIKFKKKHRKPSKKTKSKKSTKTSSKSSRRTPRPRTKRVHLSSKSKSKSSRRSRRSNKRKSSRSS